MRTYIRIYIYIQIYTCNARTRLQTYTCTYTTYIHTHIHTHIYTHIYTYIALLKGSRQKHTACKSPTPVIYCTLKQLITSCSLYYEKLNCTSCYLYIFYMQKHKSIYTPIHTSYTYTSIYNYTHSYIQISTIIKM